jgi:hypothetical protein
VEISVPENRRSSLGASLVKVVSQKYFATIDCGVVQKYSINRSEKGIDKSKSYYNIFWSCGAVRILKAFLRFELGLPIG